MSSFFATAAAPKRGSSFFSTPYDIEPVNRQIENARIRIADAGFDPGDADKRNWFEKLTNLPEDQNAFFDVLELIGRPGAAVVNAINESSQGRDALQGAWRGFAGIDRTRGADLAENMGVENKVGKFLTGTALDIGLDPLTYVPGGVLAKGIKQTAFFAGKPVVNSYKALERAAPSVQVFREGVQDAFGRAFVPDYKLGEDLYGQADDAIVKAKQTAENDIRFRTEESMKNVADTAKLAGGVDTGADVGRIMESGLKQFDEAGNALPRIERELSSDPNIRQAAETLLQTNKELRDWAEANGVSISELEGYMTHILSREERKRRDAQRVMPVDRGNFGEGQPNKKILNERQYKGSVEDINEQAGRDIFEPNAYFATAVEQKRLIEYVNAAKFRREVLSNPRFAQKYEKGMEVPKNAVVIDTNNYKFLPDELGELAEEIGGEYIVTKSVKTALDRYKKLTSDEGINGFLKSFDTLQSGWKRLALFSVPYHLRNDIGAKFNNWVGGMNLASLAKYSAQADKEVYQAVINGVESPMYREFREQGLGSSGLSAVEFARRGEDPEVAIRRTIEKRSEFDGTLPGRLKAEAKSLKNPLNAFETSKDFGNFVDQTNRYALYKWAREKGLTPEQAAAKVREVQFDYTRTTPLESEVFARIAPFYRWMRNNLPFQIRQFINDPRKYANINDTRINAQEATGVEEENVPEWMKESFAMPVYGDGSGSGKFLGFNLPVGDLAKLSDPLKLVMDSVTPLAKLPAELAMNRNFFYDKAIEKFEGQEKQFQVPFGGPEFGVDATLAYVLEQLTGQPGRALSGYLQRPESVDQDTQFRMPSLGISSLLKDFDVNKAKYFEGRQDLQQLLDLIRYIEQQTGQPVRTMQEINRGR